MTKTEQLDELFKEWEAARPEYQGKFIKDGIINEELYNKAPVKVLFIAKEANHGDDPKPGDFREWWKGRIDHAFSYRVAEWAHGVLNDFPPFEKVHFGTNKSWQNLYSNALQSIAFLDVKKSGGGGKADHAKIKDHIFKNRDFLNRQIEIIEPNIIVSSLVDINLVNALFRVQKDEWVKSGYVRALFRRSNARVIDFYHPSSRNVPAASYSLLQNIIRSEPFRNL